jgi:hypothetical protein
MKNYPEAGIQVPDILLPNKSISLEKWAVVACDQYTSQPEYWEKVSQIIDGSASAYHMILPEAFLGRTEESDHLSRINSSMRAYLESGLFQETQGFIYVERSFGQKTRQGLIAALDLERYDFHTDSQSLVRATEGTIIDRLPPRIKIRENAPLEIPHILVLIDDPFFTVIEPLAAKVSSLQKLYDLELMLGGGHLRGFLINDLTLEQLIISMLGALSGKDIQKQKYNHDSAPFLYAVGDGNHSLAAAKSLWEKIKGSVSSNHPARFALVEIANIHNEGIVFEPIHRLAKNVNFNILEALSSFFSGKIIISKALNFESLAYLIKDQKTDSQLIGLVNKDQMQIIEILDPIHTLPVGSLQLFLDDLIKKHPEIALDFIHGENALMQLASEPNNVGFYLPAMEKSSLFKSVIKDGPLPRKTFSMGEAHEKRYYLECRKIRIDGK